MKTQSPNAIRLLLVQIRHPTDAMLSHEQQCILNKLQNHPTVLNTKNAVCDAPSADWLHDVDAVIVGGSGDFSVHVPESRAFVDPMRHLFELLLSRDIPTFAICFGHQLLGLHLGANVRTSEAHGEIGTIHLQLNEAGGSDPLFSQLPPTFTAQTGHGDYVVEAPAGADVLAHNDCVNVQAMKVQGRHFYSTQFHPDMTGMEARHRYLTYYPSVDEIIDARAARFSLKADDASTLLAAFIDGIKTRRLMGQGVSREV